MLDIRELAHDMKPTYDALGTYLDRVQLALASVEATDARGKLIGLSQAGNWAAKLLLSTRDQSRKLVAIGNGGSAAIALHLQVDLCRVLGLRVVTFESTPLLTALSNDKGFHSVFKEQVALWASRGDILFAISSSGHSENVHTAVRTAQQLGCHVVTFSGLCASNLLRAMGELNFYVRSDVIGHVETVHSAIMHFLTHAVVAELASTQSKSGTKGWGRVQSAGGAA